MGINMQSAPKTAGQQAMTNFHRGVSVELYVRVIEPEAPATA